LSKRHIPLGKIVGTHGIAGWVKLKLFNPASAVLFSTQKIRLTSETHSASYTLDQAKPHKRIVLVKLAGVDNIDSAERLVGAEVAVPMAALTPLAHDEYYYVDVVGFDVFDTNENYLGKITSVLLKDGGDLYVVGSTNKEHLIPATREIIDTVDLPNQRMIVDLPDGLLDL